jgi:hypothetical protein
LETLLIQAVERVIDKLLNADETPIYCFATLADKDEDCNDALAYFRRKHIQLGVVVYVCNSSIQEGEAGRL